MVYEPTLTYVSFDEEGGEVKVPVYKTGISVLDNLIDGYELGVIHEFYGSTGAGKTTLAGYIPIGAIFKAKLKELQRKGEIAKDSDDLPREYVFIVVDVDSGFDFIRASQIWKLGFGLSPSKVMKHVVYYQPTSFADQNELICEKLEDEIESKGWKPLLITVDAIVTYYQPIVIKSPAQYRASVAGEYTGKIGTQLASLRSLAVKYMCPVTIVSWERSPLSKVFESTSENPMIGGRLAGFLPKIIIELKKFEDVPHIRKARIHKHRHKPENIFTYFQLCNEGIRDPDSQLVELVKKIEGVEVSVATTSTTTTTSRRYRRKK